MFTNMLPVCFPAGLSDEIRKIEIMSIYPNPFNITLTITINNFSSLNNVTINIYNVSGEEVLSNSLTKQFTIVETANLPAGIYVYKVSNGGQTIQTRRLISQ